MSADASRPGAEAGSTAARTRRLVLAVAMTALVAGVVVAPSPAAADQVRDDQWHLNYLQVPRAHELSQGDGMTVAVLDSGVDGDHPDLAGNVLPGIDTWSATHGGDPGDGWDDADGHGTAMAGLIAAHGHGEGNGDGALGLAPRAQIIPIEVQPGNEDPASLDQTYSESFQLAITEAMNRGADIISIAQTGFQIDDVQPALDAGKIVVVSAGNQPDNHFINAPPGTVAVGAVRSDGAIADVSTRGQLAPPPLEELGVGFGAQFGFVWLTAPGEDIVSTSHTGDYRMGTGTSPSTSIIAGAAALVWARFPELTGDQVIHHLLSTSTDKGAPGPDTEYGYGDLDVVRALETQPSPPTTTTTSTVPPPPLPEPSDEQAAAVEGDGDGAALLVGVMVVVAGAAIAATGLGGALVNRRRLRSAFAAPGAGAAVRPPPPGEFRGTHPPPPVPGTGGPPPPILPPGGPPPARPVLQPGGPRSPDGAGPAARSRRRTKTLIAVAVLGVVVVVAGVAYAVTASDSDSPPRAPVTGAIIGEPTEPPTGVDELDDLGQSCFDGDMAGCDDLFNTTLAMDFDTPGVTRYWKYAMSCGGRFADDIAHSCAIEVPDA